VTKRHPVAAGSSA